MKAEVATYRILPSLSTDPPNLGLSFPKPLFFEINANSELSKIVEFPSGGLHSC